MNLQLENSIHKGNPYRGMDELEHELWTHCPGDSCWNLANSGFTFFVEKYISYKFTKCLLDGVQSLDQEMLTVDNRLHVSNDLWNYLLIEIRGLWYIYREMLALCVTPA